MKAILVCLVVLCTGAFSAPNDVSPRILGGQDAVRGQFPFVGSIKYCIQNTCQHSCGGVIIGSLWVLSTAHCITQAPGLGSYEFIAGILNLDDTNTERQTIRVSYVLIHPDYEGGTNPYDISIFRLAAPLSFSNQVQPIGLPDQDEVFEGDVYVIGWGSTAATEVPVMPNTLQYVQTPIVIPTTCKTALDSVLGGQPHPLDQEANICTGPLTGGVSICTGDSGGPVSDIQGQTLIGISSWTVNPCGLVGAPSVHNRVSHFRRWIQASISI